MRYGRPERAGAPCIGREDGDADRFLNRELSWLDFNARVLALAEDAHRPAARAGQVPRHLRHEPRRVLPGAGRRAQGAGRGRASGTAYPGRARPARAAPRRSASRSTSSSSARRTLFTEGASRRRSSGGHPLRPTGTSSTTTTASSSRGVRRAHLPGAHPARRRPRPPLPVHLQPVAQPRRRGPRPGDRRAALRPGEGPAAAPPLRRAARRRALRAARAGDRGAPRRGCSPGWRSSTTIAVPRHPRRRPRARGRGRRPPRGGRDRAAPAPSFGRAVRLEVDAHDVRGDPRAALPRARAPAEQRS